MEEELLHHQVVQEPQLRASMRDISFRECRKEAGSFGPYQKRLFLLMGLYWITASFFLILPFYIFKKPNYFDCNDEEYNQTCIAEKCSKFNFPFANKAEYVKEENTLTYEFNLFCEYESWRVFYKVLGWFYFQICPESLSWIGLIIYGLIGDIKGRKVAFKISWRFYTIGLIFFTATRTQFLISFGYFIACINCFPSLVIQFVLLFEQIDRTIRLRACLLLLAFLLIGPLFASFLAELVVQERGVQQSIAFLCTVPAIILSFVTSFLEQSAIFCYKSNKMAAFSIVNKIAKINKIKPLVVDFSRSTWLKFAHYDINLLDAFRHKGTQLKLIIGSLFMFTFFFNNRLAQLSLDQFTNAVERGVIMNSTSAIAIITVIIINTRYQIKKHIYIAILNLIIVLVTLILRCVLDSQSDTSRIFEKICSIGLRYISDLSYSIFLIWSIETFPTVCRTQCLSFVLCGCSFGSILAYSFSSNQILLLIISLFLSFLVVILSNFLNPSHENRLFDTLTGEYYDAIDIYYKA